ncbi:hypothetical protein QTG54_012294 [Skeletonema marinoi]|uniref:Uncharacterized protein n=1 Tax=Skeletonema marinoi TaxID=267567 RepID=A0AAD8Y060_9STRA|nr:hypothetical protein QTG54_012294 [Skeletonema marinoi]
MYIAAFVVAAISYSRANEFTDRGKVWDFNDLPMTITAVIYLLELLYEFSWYQLGQIKDVRTYFVPVIVVFLHTVIDENTLPYDDGRDIGIKFFVVVLSLSSW